MNTPDPAPLPPALLAALRAEIGDAKVVTDPAECWTYGYDNSRRQIAPQAVVFATSEADVATTLRLCTQHRVPVTARGRGTGTTGGAVPLQAGVVLSLERMNRILQVDPANRLLIAETGATNESLQLAAAAHGFFWPPDPTSAAVCTLGGNLALNAAGPRAVKYGTTRDNVLGLRAVLGDGRTLHTGVMTTKGVVGYDFTRLLIGSEGTLAVITEATLRLVPLPETRRTLQAVYRDIHSAATAVAAIMAQPVTPCALEFMDAASIDMIRGYTPAALPETAGALLMIEVDGSAVAIDSSVEAVSRAARNDGLLSLTVARTEAEAGALWATRKALSPALRKIAPNKLNEDVVVPVSNIPALIDGLAALSREFGIPIVNFGHAGNGNIHVNLLYDSQQPQQAANARPCLDRVFALVMSLHGALSGEHGVGIEKRDYTPLELDPVAIDLMRRLKHEFDPAGILNPGKVLPVVAG
jgi:D-lactate dehydrogenase